MENNSQSIFLVTTTQRSPVMIFSVAPSAISASSPKRWLSSTWNDTPTMWFLSGRYQIVASIYKEDLKRLGHFPNLTKRSRTFKQMYMVFLKRMIGDIKHQNGYEVILNFTFWSLRIAWLMLFIRVYQGFTKWHENFFSMLSLEF
jgi:hypothetical protein